MICRNAIDVEGIRVVQVLDLGYPRWLRTLYFALNHRRVLKTISFDVVLGLGNTLELGCLSELWRCPEGMDGEGDSKL